MHRLSICLISLTLSLRRHSRVLAAQTAALVCAPPRCSTATWENAPLASAAAAKASLNAGTPSVCHAALRIESPCWCSAPWARAPSGRAAPRPGGPTAPPRATSGSSGAARSPWRGARGCRGRGHGRGKDALGGRGVECCHKSSKLGRQGRHRSSLLAKR
jgi:hypothetical protein